ncbi:NUDIX hydrolase [Mycolicibacterium sp. CBMA 226]|uniref:NUDIX domain-containing protein n=1 Tax=Mycolicibacterium sp. CBMA 226 TaxID=2606611 RepID=UPI00130C94B2|nr:NUDIX hydrolase [Mycolicibacterium sp. CBMA 226]MUL79082.1 NUDIX hydrolase [Mycolicibacterium sp. CBMA 226]
MAEHDFATLSSETVYVGKIFALRADEVAMPGGGSARREVVEHYGAVAIVALDEDDNLVLVYQYRHPIGRRLWELPAGLLDMGDEPPHRTAARELEEETGLAAEHWQPLIDVDSTPGFSDESVRIFLATGLTEIGRPHAHDEEADLVVKRVPLADAVQMVFDGEIVNALAVAGILATAQLKEAHRPVDLRPLDAPWIDRPSALRTRRENG